MDPEGEIKFQMDFWKELTNSIELIEPYFASCDTESKSLSIDNFCF